MSVAWTCPVFLLLTAALFPSLAAGHEVVYAVNCGGGKHVDRFGVRYAADDNKVGVPSAFGQSLSISRVHPDDMILYQTERYHTSTFTYEIPIDEDGDYYLITKYAEVYFTSPRQKVTIEWAWLACTGGLGTGHFMVQGTCICIQFG